MVVNIVVTIIYLIEILVYVNGCILSPIIFSSSNGKQLILTNKHTDRYKTNAEYKNNPWDATFSPKKLYNNIPWDIEKNIKYKIDNIKLTISVHFFLPSLI